MAPYVKGEGFLPLFCNALVRKIRWPFRISTLSEPSVNQFNRRASIRWCQVFENELTLVDGFDDAFLVRAVEVGVAAGFDVKDERTIRLIYCVKP